MQGLMMKHELMISDLIEHVIAGQIVLIAFEN